MKPLLYVILGSWLYLTLGYFFPKTMGIVTCLFVLALVLGNLFDLFGNKVRPK